ncbi:MAG: TonB-dependent receptor [Sphingorhabdus sp.]|jgi:iron complex outermembrane receptor protein|uniref:TonB-dependent receptor family protein n=1 Tax=Sphingorhabdus sp. TaxID=1902408 RepID=UPI0025D84FD8|nr:TonB-dependent receptor [Sphingorhabdus sp.]MCO4092646.1 TonB-dependent receptor [Sphingorhabdus sp.]
MKFLSILRASAACSFCAIITPAAAEDAADATIIVTGRAAADQAEVTANQTAGGTDIVSHQDYADKTIVSLRDTLAFSPGVYTQPRFGQEIRISIRGSGLSRGFHMRGLTLLQDGIPINLADDNGDFQELEPIFFDHLEVYRGANALRFGSGTLGGAVNGVTPTGDNAAGLYLRGDVGSFDFYRGLASFGLGDEDANAWAAISADSHKGDRQHARRDSIRFHGNVGLQISDIISTRFYGSITTLDQELPGAMTRATALTAPRSGNFIGDQARDIDSIRIQNRTRFNWGNSHLDVGAFLNSKELYHPIFQVVDQVSTDRGVYARYERSGDVWSMTLGGESRWGSIDAKRFVNLNGKRGVLTFDADQTARTTNIYGEIRVSPIENLTVVAGGIYADGFRKQSQIVPAAVTAQASFDAVSPKMGVLWEPAGEIQFFANYSKSAEFPTFVELAQIAAFVPVREQTAWTTELGTRGTLGWVSWDVAVYRANIKREMLQFTVGPDIPAATFNADKTRHQGVEAAFSATPTNWLRFRQIWQYSDFRFVGDAQYGDNRLPVVPKHVLRSELRLGGDKLHISPNVEWVPQGAWADYRNTTRNAGYTLLGVSAGARIKNGVDIFVDARNLAGVKAIGDVSAAVVATPASAIYYPVERRAIYGGVRARF